MSLDALTECTECKGHSAIVMWVQAFRSFDQARLHGAAPDFLSCMIPGPGILKVEICGNCRTFRPLFNYTKEEEEAIRKYKELNESKNRTAESLGKLLGQGGPEEAR